MNEINGNVDSYSLKSLARNMQNFNVIFHELIH